MKALIQKVYNLTDKVLNGKALSYKEAKELAEIKEPEDIVILASYANLIRKEFVGDFFDICSLVNAKSGACSEDCKFCAQSAHYRTNVRTYPLMEVDEIVEKAIQMEKEGADRFCIVTSGKTVSKKEFEKIKDALSEIRRKTSLKLDCSLGLIPKDWLAELKDAGVTRINHNLETSENYFGNICTTHTFAQRRELVKMIKESGIEACCGGIIGMGESMDDRLSLAFTLKELEVDCVPINILDPREGTPLQNTTPLPPLESIKTIAIYRFILPKATIKVCGGREKNLRDLQSLAFCGGANGMIIGGYLTTSGRNCEMDLKMVEDLSFKKDKR